MIHDLSSRDREDGLATWQPQGLEPEGVLDSTSEGARPEDDRMEGHIRGRSRRIMNYPGVRIANSLPGDQESEKNVLYFH